MVTSKLTKSTGCCNMSFTLAYTCTKLSQHRNMGNFSNGDKQTNKEYWFCNMSFTLAYTCSKLSHHRNMGNFSNGYKQTNKEYWLLQHEFYAGVHLFKTFTA